MKRLQKRVSKQDIQDSKAEEEKEEKNEDIRRLLPRTAALFGAVIPSANQHVQSEDVQSVYVQLVKWLQNQRLVQAAEMAIRSYIDGLSSDSEEDRSELHILKARQYMISNEMKHAKSEADNVYESNEQSSPLRAAAALVLANILRRINENREEEMRLLDIAIQNQGCEKHDGDVSIGQGVDIPGRLQSRIRLGRIKLFDDSKEAHVQAASIFGDITNQLPHFNMCKVLRAQALLRLGDIEKAEPILNLACEKNSQYPCMFLFAQFFFFHLFCSYVFFSSGTYAAMASLSLASDPIQVKTAAQYASMVSCFFFLRRSFYYSVCI